MLTDGKDLIVIDEWPDADTFNTFFAGATRMGEFLSGVGVSGEPEITILDALDVTGTTFDRSWAARPHGRIWRLDERCVPICHISPGHH